MKKAQEYRQHAQECRVLARGALSEDHRSQLLNMADTWEALAVQRERILIEQRSLDEGYYGAPPVPHNASDRPI